MDEMRTKIVGQRCGSANIGPPQSFNGTAANNDTRPIHNSFSNIAKKNEFDAFALLDINVCNGENIQPQIVLENLNPDLMEIITAEGDLGACTLFDLLGVSNVPFGWQIGFDPLTGKLSEVGSVDEQFDQLLETFTIRGGYCVPLHSANSHRCVVIYFTHRREGEQRYPELALETVELFDELLRSKQLILSEAQFGLSHLELKCLRWSADGKSISEIAYNLSLSEHAIGLFFMAAKAKLNTKTLAEAVFKASNNGVLGS